jgi:CBS-domain-containing membrane protein
MNVEQVMTRDCATVQQATSLNDAAHLMWTRDCGSLPVVDEENHVIGMVTDRDICMCAYYKGNNLKELRVFDAMSHSPVCCGMGDDLDQVQWNMRQAQVRRIPVVDEQGYLNGIITLGQIARARNDDADGVASREVCATLAAICRPADQARGSAPAARQEERMEPQERLGGRRPVRAR